MPEPGVRDAGAPAAVESATHETLNPRAGPPAPGGHDGTATEEAAEARDLVGHVAARAVRRPGGGPGHAGARPGLTVSVRVNTLARRDRTVSLHGRTQCGNHHTALTMTFAAIHSRRFRQLCSGESNDTNRNPSDAAYLHGGFDRRRCCIGHIGERDNPGERIR